MPVLLDFFVTKYISADYIKIKDNYVHFPILSENLIKRNQTDTNKPTYQMETFPGGVK